MLRTILLSVMAYHPTLWEYILNSEKNQKPFVVKSSNHGIDKQISFRLKKWTNQKTKPSASCDDNMMITLWFSRVIKKLLKSQFQKHFLNGSISWIIWVPVETNLKDNKKKDFPIMTFMTWWRDTWTGRKTCKRVRRALLAPLLLRCIIIGKFCNSVHSANICWVLAVCQALSYVLEIC